MDYEFKVYPGKLSCGFLRVMLIHILQGTAHGFAARPNLAYPEVKAGYEGAFEQAVQWFKKTLF